MLRRYSLGIRLFRFVKLRFARDTYKTFFENSVSMTIKYKEH